MLRGTLISVLVLYIGTHVNACDPVFMHPQSEFCLAEFVAEVHIDSQLPLSESSEYTYKVTIGNVFRGKNVLKRPSVDNTTLHSNGPFNSCGAQHLVVNDRYLVGGHVSDGSLRSPGFGILRRMDAVTHAYRSDMEKYDCSCEIQFEWYDWDRRPRNDNECAPNGGDFCELYNSVCERRNGVCTWSTQGGRC